MFIMFLVKSTRQQRRPNWLHQAASGTETHSTDQVEVLELMAANCEVISIMQRKQNDKSDQESQNDENFKEINCSSDKQMPPTSTD